MARNAASKSFLLDSDLFDPEDGGAARSTVTDASNMTLEAEEPTIPAVLSDTPTSDELAKNCETSSVGDTVAAIAVPPGITVPLYPLFQRPIKKNLKKCPKPMPKDTSTTTTRQPASQTRTDSAVLVGESQPPLQVPALVSSTTPLAPPEKSINDILKSKGISNFFNPRRTENGNNARQGSKQAVTAYFPDSFCCHVGATHHLTGQTSNLAPGFHPKSDTSTDLQPSGDSIGAMHDFLRGRTTRRVCQEEKKLSSGQSIPKVKANRSALSRLLRCLYSSDALFTPACKALYDQLISPSTGFGPDGSIFSDKPLGRQQEDVSSALERWLEHWKYASSHKPPKKRRKRTSGSDSESPLSDWEDYWDVEWNAASKNIMLIGAPGSGKTRLIHSAAKRCGYNVLEINASCRRSAKDILTILTEATQSQALPPKDGVKYQEWELYDTRDGPPLLEQREESLNAESDGLDASQAIVAVQQLEGVIRTAKKTRRQNLIFFDEVDFLSEDDKGFWKSVLTLLENSKCPAAFACNDNPLTLSNPSISSTTLPLLKDLITPLYFTPPSVEELTCYNHLTLLSLNTWIEDPSDLARWSEAARGDIRRCVHRLPLALVPSCRESNLCVHCAEEELEVEMVDVELTDAEKENTFCLMQLPPQCGVSFEGAESLDFLQLNSPISHDPQTTSPESTYDPEDTKPPTTANGLYPDYGSSINTAATCTENLSFMDTVLRSTHWRISQMQEPELASTSIGMNADALYAYCSIVQPVSYPVDAASGLWEEFWEVDVHEERKEKRPDYGDLGDLISSGTPERTLALDILPMLTLMFRLDREDPSAPISDSTELASLLVKRRLRRSAKRYVRWFDGMVPEEIANAYGRIAYGTGPENGPSFAEVLKKRMQEAQAQLVYEVMDDQEC
ncbi:uncharacterized protein SPPG_01838 [Spizellomyces punctatus DAOM BR117]|uniref:AAA+ ATPase domain-containing protein n=1 Tax=Spizellomyces punctatus (strain DAOM BR117) TaxID=645134 RepID=A0A0L0HP62_SPIPD|nr:uncharacterized protein SPPG_01838 [Spizellomyces punctatus DAOM BR117]KND02755.1 hypothetical protein SPPG_01838 [Spizellomyces punctatus DAOM BR117]|eukprot:XP_016610794.1 hypothetical protein SPPG_01838 [Spizellomyces punctatus DAOM BR117]